MTADVALQFLAHEAARCRDRDAHEAFCLLLPALCTVLGLRPLDDVAALEFHREFHNTLRSLNNSPLVEAHCAACHWPETLPVIQFQRSPGVDHWCDHCQRETWFVRSEVAA